MKGAPKALKGHTAYVAPTEAGHLWVRFEPWELQELTWGDLSVLLKLRVMEHWKAKEAERGRR